MRSALDIFDDLFAFAFPGDSWRAWRAFLAALFGLPACAQYADIIRACTGRQTLPTAPAREAWMVVGRRGGKSRLAAFLAVFAACFRTYRLSAGERGVVMCLAADRKQAGVIFRYVAALIDGVPMLHAMVTDRTRDSIDLSNGITITIQTASFRSVRGFTVVAAIADEIAFWETGEDSANPDAEIIAALRPAMATIDGALLVALSSPYARRGELWRNYDEHYGEDGDPILVWQAPSLVMNPALAPHVVEQAYAEDEAAASAEFGAEFRKDIESFLSREVIRDATIGGRLELPPASALEYHAFTDPSGGAGGDSYTLAIAHTEGARVIVDAIREVRPPYQPEVVTADFAMLCRRYRIDNVRGDRYAGEWPREQWRKHGVTYYTSDKTKSEIYLEALPLLTGGRVELPEHRVLLSQLGGLERRTSRAGKDSVDHAPRKRDDVANAVCGALVRAAVPPRVALGVVKSDVRDLPAGSQTLQRMRAQKTAQLQREIDASHARMRAEYPHLFQPQQRKD